MKNYMILENVEYLSVSSFNIRQNGIQVLEDENTLEIYNDPFRTIPLFITKDQNEKLLIFSNFEDYYTFENIDKTIDEVGFWEIVLFGSGLWTRTLYKNVKQMPSASKIIIDKKTNSYIIERYWDFNIEADQSIDSMEKAAQGLYERLDKIFSKLDKNQKYVMGMSGGMDSRISLAFLSKYIPKENLELFTYGFDERLLEYKYASESSEIFGYNKPVFFKLTVESYRNAMSYLPQKSGGQIGINHCHILEFLRTSDLSVSQHISNYYSDALFGYDCIYPKKSILNNVYINYINEIEYLPSRIKNEIKKDSRHIYSSFNVKSNYSYSNEYKYVSERNPKFHFYLAFLQGQQLPINLIYANYDLLNYMISIPIKYRQQKILLDFILEKYFNKEALKKLENISSRSFNGIFKGFSESNTLYNSFGWYSFKFLNKLNAALRPLTKGHIQLFNKYQTEEQDRLLYRDFHKDLKNATKKLVRIGVMTKDQKIFWDKLPLKSSGIGERFALTSIGQLI